MGDFSPFLALPLEIRQRIYSFVFAGSSRFLELQFSTDDYDSVAEFDHQWAEPEQGELTIAGSLHLNVRSWQSPDGSSTNDDTKHPLFLTCRQIYQESLPCDHLTLGIHRDLVVKCVKDEDGALSPEAFRRRHCLKYVWDHDIMRNAPAYIACDDFIDLFDYRVRQRITTVTLWSVFGFNGRFLNRQQFPRLDLVVIEGIINDQVDDYSERELGTYHPELEEHAICYTLEPSETPYDIKAGRCDGLLFAQAKEAAEKHTLAAVPALAERGYRLHMETKVTLRANPSHGAPGSTAAASLRLRFDFDTGETLRRSHWWCSDFYKRQAYGENNERCGE